MMNMNNTQAFTGTHIKVLFQSDSRKLHDQKLMHDFLRYTVARIGMQQLDEPTVFNIALRLKEIGANCFEDEGGLTGIVVLSTSHIAFHTWPIHENGKILDELGSAVLDVYSCRTFGIPFVLEVLEKFYQPKWGKTHDLSFSLNPYDICGELF